jgi:hypothetical protein
MASCMIGHTIRYFPQTYFAAAGGDGRTNFSVALAYIRKVRKTLICL